MPQAAATSVRSLDLAIEHLRLAIVSRLDDDMKVRGIELVIDAMEFVAQDHIDLVVVGGGTLGNGYERGAIGSTNESTGAPSR